MEFEINVCPKCGGKKALMRSNNPLSGTAICFDCIKNNLNYQNLEHADFFCRTYNLPFMPELWIDLSNSEKDNVFQVYTEMMFEDSDNRPNLVYESATHDLWSKTNREWQKSRSFAEIIDKIAPIKESYIERGRFKWGEQYTFGEIIKLDSIYTRTLKANNITNPLQKEAVKTLCKLQIEMDEAIRAKDAKAIRDFSNAWSTFAKQADLETMINETKTEDITTVAELYQFIEDSGRKLDFHLAFDRDEVDRTIKDLQDTQRKLILESTGLSSLLEEMMHKEIEKQEMAATKEATEETTLQDLINFEPSDGEVDVEDDEEALNMNFEEEEEDNNPTILCKESE